MKISTILSPATTTKFISQLGNFKIQQVSKRYLNLHEYQCKDLLKLHGLNVQKYVLYDSNSLGQTDFPLDFNEYVVKAQVLAGGRGKGTFKCGFKGGVHLTKNKGKAVDFAKKMLHNYLHTAQTGEHGEQVKTVMIADALDIKKEMYLAFVLDAALGSPVLLASPVGGVNIEEVAETQPEKLLKVPIDVAVGLVDSQCNAVSEFLGLDKACSTQLMDQLKKLYKLFISVDATQVEINPLGISTDDRIVCFDSKINFDDNAKFRQKDIFQLEDCSAINSQEKRASEYGLNYIHMDGDIACIVNGAGLAMATMDMIHYYGSSPANFLDLSGGVTTDGVKAALGIISQNDNCKKVFINIFGGIVDCAVIAKGIIEAVQVYSGQLPQIVLRLQGTNSELAREIIRDSDSLLVGSSLVMVDDFSEAAKLVCQV